MKKTCHLFNNSIYHISSKAVARNLLFQNSEDCRRFLKKANTYLGPLCEILYYSLHHAEFHFIIRLKDRESFCAFYREKYEDETLEDQEIALSTHIFSKAMSDLLVSTAKYFNYWQQRTGSLFASRYHRKLIENSEALDQTIEELKSMDQMYQQQRPWHKIPSAYKIRKKRNVLRKLKERCADYYYRRKGLVHEQLLTFRRLGELDLRGCFETLPPKSIFEIYTRIAHINYIPKNSFSPL